MHAGIRNLNPRLDRSTSFGWSRPRRHRSRPSRSWGPDRDSPAGCSALRSPVSATSPWRRSTPFAIPRHPHGKEGPLDVAIVRKELRVARCKVAGSDRSDRAVVEGYSRACVIDRNHRCEDQEDQQDVLRPSAWPPRSRSGWRRAWRKSETSHFTSICRPSFSMMPANFLVSASTKAENCCGVP